jgi:uncharacterized Rmd1/YagE family protein
MSLDEHVKSASATSDLRSEAPPTTAERAERNREDGQSLVARAIYVGERIDLRTLSQSSRFTAQQPVVKPLQDGGTGIVFRYGAAVFIDGSEASREQFLRELAPLVEDRYERPETEEMIVSVDAEKREGVEGGRILVRDLSSERLQIVAAVLAKSVALAQYENDVTAIFDRIEPYAVDLERGGRGRTDMRFLLRHIGQALLNEHKMVARVEVSDRPELLWEHPELEQLYLRLEDEFEIEERAAILDRKLELISRTVETTLDLVQKDRGIRVEWYIVILIVFEILLSLYDIFSR